MLLTKIRVGFSNPKDHRYNHKFNCESSICSCGVEDGKPVHYFLCKISNIIDSDVSVFPMEHLYKILVYGSNIFNVFTKRIISEAIQYIKFTGRFKKLEAYS